jgi:hypothetical protein
VIYISKTHQFANFVVKLSQDVLPVLVPPYVLNVPQLMMAQKKPMLQVMVNALNAQQIVMNALFRLEYDFKLFSCLIFY